MVLTFSWGDKDDGSETSPYGSLARIVRLLRGMSPAPRHPAAIFPSYMLLVEPQLTIGGNSPSRLRRKRIESCDRQLCHMPSEGQRTIRHAVAAEDGCYAQVDKMA